MVKPGERYFRIPMPLSDFFVLTIQSFRSGKKRTEEAKQRLVVYQLYEAKRKQEQTELLKKRRKAARERLAREKMAKVI